MREAVRISIMLGIIWASLSFAQRSQPLPVEWDKAAPVNQTPEALSLSSVVGEEQGQKVLQIKSEPVPGAKPEGTAPAVAFTSLPIDSLPADSAGISFEFKGDGSAHFASVFVGETASLLNGYEAFFPLDSTDWQTVTLRWGDFIKNDLPWDANARLGFDNVVPAPGKLKFIGFGRGNANYKFFTPQFGFGIRNLRAVSALPDAPVPAYSQGLARTRALLRQKTPLNILLLGDSITDMGGDKSYGWHGGQLIQRKWGVSCTIANAGVGGQTVRFGTIALPRSLRLMPRPDLVCVMYGGNDCKAANPPNEKSGYGEAVYAKNLEALIDDVRRRTDGQADILLLSGVPRLDKRGGQTTGAVEKIVGAVKKVAADKDTAYCDTFSAYLRLPAARKQAYYKDTIHQTQPGLQHIGTLLFKTIETP